MFRALPVLILAAAASVDAFSSALFQETPALKTTAPSLHDGVDVELPDFDELFNRIQQVSPLARQVINGATPVQRGFDFIDETCKFPYRADNSEEKAPLPPPRKRTDGQNRRSPHTHRNLPLSHTEQYRLNRQRFSLTVNQTIVPPCSP